MHHLNFNPRTPCGVRPSQAWSPVCQNNFNPRTPCGVRPLHSCTRSLTWTDFNPRTPCGVRLAKCVCFVFHLHFNPRTPCGVRLLGAGVWRWLGQISIHAPRVGCDFTTPAQRVQVKISIHAPRVGCDHFPGVYVPHTGLFQSTHPVWGATRPDWDGYHEGGYFNPRTPCGVRRHHDVFLASFDIISIHAPRVGCDVADDSGKLVAS